jgi:hypothetical protein
VRPDRPVPEGVDAQLGELAADALPELAGVFGFWGGLLASRFWKGTMWDEHDLRSGLAWK